MANIEEILDSVPRRVEEAAWYGKKGADAAHFVADNGKQLDFRGSVIERSYENYGTTCDIYGNGNLLFGQDSRCTGDYRIETYTLSNSRFGSYDEVASYLKETYEDMVFEETSLSFSEKQKHTPERDADSLLSQESKDMQAASGKLGESGAKDTARLQETEKAGQGTVAI